MKKKIKVLFIIPSLGSGGAERVFINLTNSLNKDKFDISLAIINSSNNVYEVPEGINYYSLNSNRVRYAAITLIKLIRKIKPDLVISTLSHLNIYLILLKPFFPNETKIIVRETGIISEKIKESGSIYKSTLQKFLYRQYKNADLIICQSNYMVNDMVETLNIPSYKITQIYNPIDINMVLQNAKENVRFKNENGLKLVFAGRLDKVKNVDQIINYFKVFNDKFPESSLYILGEGPLKKDLSTLCNRLGIQNKVFFEGFQKNPHKWIKNANLFIMASKHEGLPNILLEAIALNVPILIKEHPGGTKEILDLTKQTDRFVTKLTVDEKYFSKPSNESFDLLIKHFDIKSICNRYEKVFQEVLDVNEKD